MSVFTRNAMPGRTQEERERNKNGSLLLSVESGDSNKVLLRETEILILTSFQEKDDHCWELLEEITETDLLEDEAEESFDWEELVTSCLMNETAGPPVFSSTRLVDLSQILQEEREGGEGGEGGYVSQLSEEISDILGDWCFEVERRYEIFLIATHKSYIFISFFILLKKYI